MRRVPPGGIALDLKADPDLPAAVAHGVGQPEDAQQVDVAPHGGGHPVQGHAATGRGVGQPGGEASSDSVQQEPHRGRAVAVTDQHRRVGDVKGEGLGSAHVLLAGPEQTLDDGTIVGSVDPLVPGPELELRHPRPPLHTVDDGEHAGHVDTVTGGPGHGRFSFRSVVHDNARHPAFPRPSPPEARERRRGKVRRRPRPDSLRSGAGTPRPRTAADGVSRGPSHRADGSAVPSHRDG